MHNPTLPAIRHVLTHAYLLSQSKPTHRYHKIAKHNNYQQFSTLHTHPPPHWTTSSALPLPIINTSHSIPPAKLYSSLLLFVCSMRIVQWSSRSIASHHITIMMDHIISRPNKYGFLPHIVSFSVSMFSHFGTLSQHTERKPTKLF